MTRPGTVSTDRQPPTTAWGALNLAATILEESEGLARIDTLQDDYKAGKHDPYSALQDALWPPPEKIPRHVEGDIPGDAITGCPYWKALRRLGIALGGTGELWTITIDKLLQDPAATAQTVAAAMRKAAG